MIRMRLAFFLAAVCVLLAGCSMSGDGTGDGTVSGSGTVVYLADQDIFGVFELYMSTSGTKLNPPLGPGRTVTSFALTADATAVIYVADQDLDDVFELYRVNLATPGVITKLNGPLVLGGDVVEFAVTPDSTAVAYRADQTTDDVFELYRTVLATLVTSKLNPLPPYVPPSGKDIEAFVVLPNSTEVIYRADHDSDGVSELYRVLFATAPVSDRLI